MNTLEVPIAIEVYDGCTSATPRLKSHARRAVAPRVRSRTRGPRLAEPDCIEALQLAGALPAEVVIE